MGQQEKQDMMTCPVCGLNYQDFQTFGHLGCAACYKVFYSRLKEVLEKVQGTSTHCRDSQSSHKETVVLQAREDTLQQQLDNAIKQEDYEQAAIIHKKMQRLGSKAREKINEQNNF